MNHPSSPLGRRQWLAAGTAWSSALFLTPGLFAEELARARELTPSMTEGPFYPDHLPLDQDNDLIILNDSTTPAVGEITHLTGRLMDVDGRPLRNAVIEIWQCDANAVYLHSADSKRKKDRKDKNFQGYGKFETGSKGEYRFRTIKPVAYPGRPSPHIHLKVSQAGHELLTSQIFVAGHEGQKKDGVFKRLPTVEERKRVEAEFKRVPDSKIGEWSAEFDVVVGKTPDDRDV